MSAPVVGEVIEPDRSPNRVPCPYCGVIDPMPRTHLAGGRCAAAPQPQRQAPGPIARALAYVIGYAIALAIVAGAILGACNVISLQP